MLVRTWLAHIWMFERCHKYGLASGTRQA